MIGIIINNYYYKCSHNLKFFLLLLIVGCADNLSHYDINNIYSNFDSDSTLTVVTWNIEWFPKHENTISYLSELIFKINADIYGLQEIANWDDFNTLIDNINLLDSKSEWKGFIVEQNAYQELAYIVKVSSVNINENPYTILNEYANYFAYREPYVLEFSFNNSEYIIINNHYKCCGDGYLGSNSNDEEYRRNEATKYLKNYVDTNFMNEKIIIIGDLNDELNDPLSNNVFNSILIDSLNYMFVDLDIANGNSINWSYPTWPSHLDHIIISNELFNVFYNNGSSALTIFAEDYFSGGWNEYDRYISDHRPVGLKLTFTE